MKNKYFTSICLIFVYFFILNENSYPSSWIRQKNELYIVSEVLSESDRNKTIFTNDSNSNYFKTNSYKLYVEYGLFNKITIGGYLKDYNFYSQYLDNYNNLKKRKVKDDLYSNLFLIQNFYNKNKVLFSLQYGYYFPINYNNESKNINNIDTQSSYEIKLLFGTDKSSYIFNNKVNYYFDLGSGYKAIDNTNYNELKSNFTFGFRINSSSTLSFEYEKKYYTKNNFIFNGSNIFNEYYKNNNSDKIQFSFDCKFIDSLSTKLSFYRNFSESNSNGIIFSFIFDYF